MADDGLAVWVVEAVCGVDAASDDQEQAPVLGRILLADEVGEGACPEDAVEDALCRCGSVCDPTEEVEGIDCPFFEAIPVGVEMLKCAVSEALALFPQCLGDGHALCLVGQVVHDADEVARVDIVGQRPSPRLGLEDRQSLDDRVDGECREGGAEVTAVAATPTAFGVMCSTR